MAKPTVVGTPAAGTGTSIALPTHAVGDIIVLFAYRDGNTAVPTKPTASGTVPAWVDIDSAAGANLNSARSAYFVATATNHTSGTWTNATGMAAIVLRGQAASPLGAHAQSGTASSADVVAPSVTMTATDGSSFLLHFGGHRTVTSWGSAPAGYTLQASVATETAIYSKDTTTSDGAVTMAATCSASGGYRGQTIEILGAASGTTFNDSGSGTLTLAGTSSESQSNTTAASGSLVLAGTAVGAQVATDSRTGSLVLGGSVAQSATHSGAGNGALTLAGTRTESTIHSASSVGTITLGGTGVEGSGTTHTDSGSGTLVLDGTGVETTFAHALFVHDVETYSHDRTTKPDLALRIFDVTADSSYPAGGYAVTPGLFGLSAVSLVFSDVSTDGVKPFFNAATSKMEWFFTGPQGTPLTEVPGGTDLSGSKARVMVFGR